MHIGEGVNHTDGLFTLVTKIFGQALHILLQDSALALYSGSPKARGLTRSAHATHEVLLHL